MLIVLSPAKSLDYDSPATVADHTLPAFIDQSAQLVALLQPQTPAQIAQLMGVLKAPIGKFVRTLAEPHAKLVRTIAAVKDQKQAAA